MRRDDARALKVQRLSAISEMRQIVKGAKQEHRDMSAADIDQFDSLRTDVLKLDLDLSKAENGNEATKEYRLAGGARLTDSSEGYEGALTREFRNAGFPGASATISWEQFETASEFRAASWTGSVDTLSPDRRLSAPLGAGRERCDRAPASEAVEPHPRGGGERRARDRRGHREAGDLERPWTPDRAHEAGRERPDGHPEHLLEQRQVSSILEQDLALAVNEGLDSLVLTAVTASGFTAPGTDPLPISLRNAVTVLQAAGYNPDVAVLRPADSEAIDTSRTTDNGYITGWGSSARPPVRHAGLISKTAAWPFIAVSAAFGRMYASPVSLRAFEQDAGSTNKSTVRMEFNAAFAAERQGAAQRIAAT